MARRRPPDPPSVPAVTLVRTIRAPAAELFAAWTDARLLSRWLAAHDCVVREASADARPGGAYRIAVVCPPANDVHLTTGEYRELVPHERIVMTWRYDGPHG
ncbi:MAG TPA: SRPBCC domain-containing protein, partial [Gemmatimonadaceae bacterium]|nr:SRPBCC domain-containing protein [Gemmatimonadaceae bacterium]